MGRCDVLGCDGDDDLGFTCNECGGRFCSTHRLPENHGCRALRSSGAGTTSTTAPVPQAARGTADQGGKPYDTTKKAAIRASRVQPGGSKRLADLRRSAGAGGSGGLMRVLRALLVLVVIGGAVLAGVTMVSSGSVPSPDDVQGWVATAVNETQAFVSQYQQQNSTSTTNADRPSSTSTPATAAGLDRARVERLIHQHINEVRQERGLQPIAFDTDLRAIARYHSEDMATAGYFAHTAPDGETVGDRYDRFGYQCRVSVGGNRYATGGENIAKTYYQTRIRLDDGSTIEYESADALAAGIVSQWMHSPPHRENLLQPYWTAEGLGVAFSEEGGHMAVYATQDFC